MHLALGLPVGLIGGTSGCRRENFRNHVFVEFRQFRDLQIRGLLVCLVFQGRRRGHAMSVGCVTVFASTRLQPPGVRAPLHISSFPADPVPDPSLGTRSLRQWRSYTVAPRRGQQCSRRLFWAPVRSEEYKEQERRRRLLLGMSRGKRRAVLTVARLLPRRASQGECGAPRPK